MVEILLAHGTKATTGLHNAILLNRPDMVDLLLAHNGDVNISASNGQTPLHWAAIRGALEIAAGLIKGGANINAKDQSGRTPLHWAGLHGHEAITNLLLANGAEVDSEYKLHQMTSAIRLTLLSQKSESSDGTTGTIARVDGLTVEVDFEPTSLPAMHNALEVATDPRSILEVEAHLSERLVRSTALTTTADLQPGLKAVDTGQPLTVPIGEQVLGRIINALGDPIDGLAPLMTAPRRPIYPTQPMAQSAITTPQILETGIKIIDLFAPLKRGGKWGCLTPRYGLGQLVVVGELIYRLAAQYGGLAVGVSLEKRRDTAKAVEHLWRSLMVEDKTAVVLGLSNDPPTLRQRLVRTGLALAEAFREQGCQEGVLVIEGDLALADQLAGLEELVGITSIGAISTLFWGLWDEIKQKAKGTFAQLDTVITFDPGRGEQRLYPAIDPLRSTSTILDLQVVGETHVKIAQQMRALLKQYNNLRETVETQGLDTLSGEDRQVAIRARRLHRFLTQPFFVAEPFMATPGKYVPLAETLKGCQALLDGQYDNLPEEAFYFVGTIEEAIEKARD
jgi:F-type H+-transporting ATPase subunit beta